MKIEIRAIEKNKELVFETEVTKEQIPFFIQTLHRQLSEFYEKQN